MSGAAGSTLGEADDGRVVRLAPGDSFEVRLPENATTGYRWGLVKPVEPVLRLVDESVLQAADAGVGSGGTRRLRFTAQYAGLADLELALARVWEGTTSATRRFAVQVEVRDPGATRSGPRPT